MRGSERERERERERGGGERERERDLEICTLYVHYLEHIESFVGPVAAQFVFSCVYMCCISKFSVFIAESFLKGLLGLPTTYTMFTYKHIYVHCYLYKQE